MHDAVGEMDGDRAGDVRVLVLVGDRRLPVIDCCKVNDAVLVTVRVLENVSVSHIVTVGLGRSLLGDNESVGVRLTVCESSPEKLGVRVTLSEGSDDVVRDGDGVGEEDGVGEGEADSVGSVESVGEGLRVWLPSGDVVSDCDALRLPSRKDMDNESDSDSDEVVVGDNVVLHDGVSVYV
jgi:hypothetical protein